MRVTDAYLGAPHDLSQNGRTGKDGVLLAEDDCLRGVIARSVAHDRVRRC